jgi:hypothetical protein
VLPDRAAVDAGENSVFPVSGVVCSDPRLFEMVCVSWSAMAASFVLMLTQHLSLGHDSVSLCLSVDLRHQIVNPGPVDTKSVLHSTRRSNISS